MILATHFMKSLLAALALATPFALGAGDPFAELVCEADGRIVPIALGDQSIANLARFERHKGMLPAGPRSRSARR